MSKTLGGGLSGTGCLVGFFDFPSATRTKLPIPTTKASGKSKGCRSFDQSFLTRIVGMFLFVLNPDVRLEVDQAGIILRFHGFPNGGFQLVEFHPINLAD